MNGAIGVAIGLVVTLMATSPFASVAYADGNSGMSKRLVLFQGFILNAYYNDQYLEVKRLDVKNGRFYGYGWLDNSRVFVAYQGDDAEAFAELEVIDLRNRRTTKLKAIGGVGESLFDVNPTTGDVIYSTGDAISLIKIDAITNSYRIEHVKQNTDCWAAFWIDSKSIGCRLIESDGSSSFVKYTVSEQEGDARVR